MKLNMGKLIVAVFIPALIGIISCSDNPITSAGENAESGRSESNGEHAGNGDGEGHEGREGSEGGAGRLVASAGGDEGGEGSESHASREGSESHAGSESSDEGGDEGGEGQQLAPDQRYDQTRNGARLIMSYSSQQECVLRHSGEYDQPNFAPGAGGGASVRRVRRDHRGVGPHLAEESHAR